MKFNSILLLIVCSLLTISNVKMIASEARSTEKVKERYSFKKGKKNQAAMNKIGKGYKHY